MALIELKKDPSARELRFFGLLLLLFFAAAGGVVYWHTDSRVAPVCLGATGGLLALVYYAIPPLRRWIYLGWLYAAFPIGWCISTLLLTVTFYLVLTPVGLLMRILRYDPLRRRQPRDAASYWSRRPGAGSVSSYFRQF